MAEAQGGLSLVDGVGCLDDVTQQVTLCERHHTARLRGSTVVEIPSDVTHAPLLVDLLVGIEREEVDVGVVTLHVGNHLEEVIHQRQGLDVVPDPLGIVEEQAHEAIGGDAVGWCAAHLASQAALRLEERRTGSIQVILQGLADVVMDACRGIGCCELLALGHHRQDAAVDGGGAGVNLYTRALENLREVLSHASSDAVMLTFAHGAQVAQTQLGASILSVQSREVGYGLGHKAFHQSQHLFALRSQFACLASLLERTGDAGVAVVADEPSRAVTPVVR